MNIFDLPFPELGGQGNPQAPEPPPRIGNVPGIGPLQGCYFCWRENFVDLRPIIYFLRLAGQSVVQPTSEGEAFLLGFFQQPGQLISIKKALEAISDATKALQSARLANALFDVADSLTEIQARVIARHLDCIRNSGFGKGGARRTWHPKARRSRVQEARIKL